jgi:protein-S-isoprenylcysteine O-methyltransferase Ste14
MTGVAMTELPSQPDNTPDPSPPDHANVVVHPPVLWVLLVAAGYGLDFWLPLPFLPAGFPAAWVGGGVWLAGFVLAGLAIAEFRRAGTKVQTHTPTAAIVDTGVFAFTRNPIYVGAHIGIVGVAIALDSLWI